MLYVLRETGRNSFFFIYLLSPLLFWVFDYDNVHVCLHNRWFMIRR